jgi:BASS family bile acid:Na+ symporter
MALSQWIVLALKLSIFLLVFALGLQTNIRNVGHLLARPGKFLRSVLAMNVLMPLFAVALAAAAPLSYAVKVMLVAVALAPMPPCSAAQRKARRAVRSPMRSVCCSPPPAFRS